MAERERNVATKSRNKMSLNPGLNRIVRELFLIKRNAFFMPFVAYYTSAILLSDYFVT